MTLYPLALLLLAPCFVLPGIIVAYLWGNRHSSSTETATKIQTSLKGLRAEVRDLCVDAREQAWHREDWGGPERYLADRLTESSCEVIVLTRYAETSVFVAREEGGTERRRCSLCLN
jgi:hypothetical protein